MKPEFLRPFDAAAACRGAPFCCTNGWRAEVLKYAANGLFGTITKPSGEEYPASWTIAGESDSGVISKDKDLAMLPLGRIEGKPVFVGDRLLDGKGAEFTVTAGQVFGPGCLCKWAPPAKVYPETTMRHEDMFDVYAFHLRSRGYTSVGADSNGLAAVANAALRHAVDAGQVVPKDEHEAALHRLGDRLKGITLGDRAERDMDIALAVRSAAYAEVMNCAAGHEGTVVRQLNITTIIATVK